MLKNKKRVILLGIIIIIGLIILFIKFSNPKPEQQNPQDEILPKSEIIPTVDASVVVNLTSKNKREVVLKINKIPSGTTSIEYELSYLAKSPQSGPQSDSALRGMPNAAGDLPKGVIGTIEVENENTIERKITLGTCSSGKCVYDQGVEKIKVSLKFSGGYGSRLFEKEFEI